MHVLTSCYPFPHIQGNCKAGNSVDPATEVLAQNNTYYDFVVGAPAAADFDLPAACAKQRSSMATNTIHSHRVMMSLSGHIL